MRRTRSAAGFTITELMIVVGIIGVIAAVAIPNYVRYQARARRGEAVTNLAAMAKFQDSHFSEQGEYFEQNAYPNPATDSPTGALGSVQMTWTAASDDAYAPLGWRPEDQVFYSYDVNTGANACQPGCANCFTATATGDVDSDGNTGLVVFFRPQTDSSGGVIAQCPTLLGTHWAPPGAAGNSVFDEPVPLDSEL